VEYKIRNGQKNSAQIIREFFYVKVNKCSWERGSRTHAREKLYVPNFTSHLLVSEREPEKNTKHGEARRRKQEKDCVNCSGRKWAQRQSFWLWVWRRFRDSGRTHMHNQFSIFTPKLSRYFVQKQLRSCLYRLWENLFIGHVVKLNFDRLALKELW